MEGFARGEVIVIQDMLIKEKNCIVLHKIQGEKQRKWKRR